MAPPGDSRYNTCRYYTMSFGHGRSAQDAMRRRYNVLRTLYHKIITNDSKVNGRVAPLRKNSAESCFASVGIFSFLRCISAKSGFASVGIFSFLRYISAKSRFVSVETLFFLQCIFVMSRFASVGIFSFLRYISAKSGFASVADTDGITRDLAFQIL